MKTPIMKVFALCMVCLFCSSAGVWAQRVSTHGEKVTLKEAFQKIEAATSLKIGYNTSQINVEQTVTLPSGNVDAKQLIEDLLKNTGYTYKIENNYVLIVPKPAQGARKKVTGNVTDVNGEPIIGASVIEKGTTNGTITDLDGNYTLDLSPQSTVVISYIGYQAAEVNPFDAKSASIVLKEDAKTLDEVVVVGYGVQKKVNLTGAVSSVKGETLDKRPVADATQSLQGLVPGLLVSNNGSGRPGASGTLTLRGQGNLSNNATPYVLVDGVEMNLSDVNPNDIESISVLKDAAASAIYGARAAYGVVLVTTKRGEEGKMRANYQGTVGWTSPTVLPKMVDSYTFAEYWNEGVKNSGSPRSYSPEKMELLKKYIQNPASVDPWQELPDGSMMNPAFENSESGIGNVDYFKLHYKKHAMKQTHNISLSGGGKAAQYYVSGGYYSEDGILRYADIDYRRFNFNANVNSQITDWLKLKTNTKFVHSIGNTPFGDGGISEGFYHSLARFRPTVAEKDPNGHFTELTMIPYLQSGTYTRNTKDGLNLTAGFEINPITDWHLFIDYTYKFDFFEYQALNVSPQIYAKDGVHTSKGVRSELGVTPDGRFTRRFSRNRYQTLNAYTNYNFSLGDHHFTLMGGYQEEDMSFSLLKNSITNLYSQTNPNVGMGTGDNVVNDNRNGWATRGFFGRINYSYQDKYLVELNGRYDGSSRFAKDHRWGFFPSVSLGWNISREQFMESIAQTVSNLKLRASWGLLGNQAGADLYTFAATMKLSNALGNYIFKDGRHAYTTAPLVVNPSTTWEKVESRNVGLDFGFFNNQLTGSLDVFARFTKDMLGPGVDFPDFFGAAAPRTNNACMENKGWELSLNYRGSKNGFTYTLGGSISDATSVVTRYANPTLSDPKSNWYEGRSVGEIWGYKTDGLLQTKEEADLYNKDYDLSFLSGKLWTPGDVKYRDLNGDHKINNGSNKLGDMGDMTIIGNSSPRYQYTLNGSVSWKDLSLSVMFQGIGKRDWDPGRAPYFWGSSAYAQVTVFKEHLDYWSETNKGAYYPKPYIHTAGGVRPFQNKNMATSDRYIQNAAYCRLKNLTLSYNIPSLLTQKIGISKLQVFFSGENLFTITHLKGMFDPEAIFTGNNYTSEGGKNYPMNRVYSLGLIINL